MMNTDIDKNPFFIIYLNYIWSLKNYLNLIYERIQVKFKWVYNLIIFKHYEIFTYYFTELRNISNIEMFCIILNLYFWTHIFSTLIIFGFFFKKLDSIKVRHKKRFKHKQIILKSDNIFSHLEVTNFRTLLRYYRWLFLLLDLNILRYDYRVPLYNYTLTDNLFRSLGSGKEAYSSVHKILVHILGKVYINGWFFSQKNPKKDANKSKAKQNKRSDVHISHL